MSGRFSNAALALVIGAVIARALQPEGRAIYALAATVASGAFALAGLSLDAGIFWLVSELKAGPRAVLRAVRVPALIAVAGGLVAYAVGAFALLRDDPTSVIVAGATLVPALVLVSTLTSTCLTAGDVRSPTAGLVASGVAQLAMVLGLHATVGLSPWSVLAVSSASQLVAAAPMVWALHRRPPEPDPPDVSPRTVVHIGLEVQPSRFAMWLTQRADILIVSILVSTRDLGLYTLGVTLAEAMLLSTESIAAAAIGSQAAGDRAATSRRSAQVATLCAIIGAVELVGLAVFGRPLISLIFGESFADSYPLAVALGVGAVATAYGRPLVVVFIRHERRRAFSAIVAVGAVMNIGLAFALVPPFGAIGAAIGSSIASIAVAVGLMVFGHRAFGTPRWLLPRDQDRG
jgi:O-antigen/teichoic acid export membrane protein